MLGVGGKVRSFLPSNLCIVVKKNTGEGVSRYSLLPAKVILFSWQLAKRRSVKVSTAVVLLQILLTEEFVERMLEDLEDLNSPEEVRLRHSHISHVLSQRVQPILQLAFDPLLSLQAVVLPYRIEAFLNLHICCELRH